MEYPVKIKAAVAWKLYRARGRIEISPGKLVLWLGVRAITMSKENFILHQGTDVYVFVVRDWPLRDVAWVVFESPEMSAVARPSYRRSEFLVQTLKDCGFNPHVERVSFLRATYPYFLLKRVREARAAA